MIKELYKENKFKNLYPNNLSYKNLTQKNQKNEDALKKKFDPKTIFVKKNWL